MLLAPISCPGGGERETNDYWSTWRDYIPHQVALGEDSFPSHSVKPSRIYPRANTPVGSKGHSAAKLLSFGSRIGENRRLEEASERHLAHSSTTRQDELHLHLSGQAFALVLTISHITSCVMPSQFTPERPAVQPLLQWSSLLPFMSPTATKINLSLCVTVPLQIFKGHCCVTLTPLLHGHPLGKRATSFWKLSVLDGVQHPAQLHRPRWEQTF